MNTFGMVFFWIMTVLVSTVSSLVMTYQRNVPVWVAPFIFIIVFLVISLVYYAIRAIVAWWKKPKAEDKKKLEQAEISNSGLNAAYKNAIKYIKENQITGGKKHFNSLPWTIYFGTRTKANEETLRLHTHFSVGDCEDESLQRNRAYILDYTILWAVDQELLDVSGPKSLDKQWADFFKKANKIKKKEPAVQQIIVELPSLMLKQGDRKEITSYARSLRDRIDQIGNFTGFRQQVVFIVSEANELKGFNELVEIMPDQLKNQAFGYMLSDPISQSASMKPLEYLVDRSQELIDIVSFQRDINVDILDFPLELQALLENYRLFTNTFFATSVYSETPLLRGLYLTGIVNDETIFTYDLIDKILEKLIQPLPLLESELQKRRKRFWRRIALWYFLFACVAGYLLFMYSKTVRELIAMIKILPGQVQYSKQFERNLVQFSAYHEILRDLENFRSRWTIRILPFRGGLDRLHNHYTDDFVEKFDQYIIAILDNRLSNMLRRVPQLSNGQKAYLVENLVTRINILEARMSQLDRTEMQGLLNPEIKNLGFGQTPHRLLRSFGSLYKDYVAWNKNIKEVRLQRGKLVQWLEDSRVLNSDFHWLLEWGNTQDHVEDYTLNDFWPGSIRYSSPIVAPGYTVEGAKSIRELIHAIQLATPVYIDISKQKYQFNVWYSENRINVWNTFAIQFDKGVGTLAYQYEWDKTFTSMMTEQGPYNTLMLDINQQFEDKLAVTFPRWIELSKRFANVIEQEKNGKVSEAKLNEQLTEWASSFTKRPSDFQADQKDDSSTQQILFRNQLSAVKTYMTYHEILEKLYEKPYFRAQDAYKSAKNLFDSQSGVSTDASRIMQAYQALVNLKRILDHYDTLDDANAFWSIMRGPLDFYILYTNRYASCYIQKQWNEQVYLKSVSLVPGEEMNSVLFDKDGLVWKFNEKYMSSFVTQVGANFIPKYVLNHKMPINPRYYAFLKTGNRLNYENNLLKLEENKVKNKMPLNVTIKSRPTSVNKGARLFPYRTLLTVHCAKDEYRLDNYNYPSEVTIKDLNFDTCGETSIEIFFPAVTLKIDYPGKLGFFRFMDEFDRGGKYFSVKSFPENHKFLNRNRVKSIHLLYAFNGADGLLKSIKDYLRAFEVDEKRKQQLNRKIQVPRIITQCWEKNQND